MATIPARRDFLRQALKYFSRQIYVPKELIVIDDPGAAASDLTKDVPGVCYMQTGAPLTLGSKLNAGIQQARGEIIQKLDDDDYYHPEFLASTVRALLERNRIDSIVACTSCPVLIASTGELKWNGEGSFAGGTFCFFKELWRRGPFQDVSVAEDRLFLADHDALRIGIPNLELYIYVRHDSGHLWREFLEPKRLHDGTTVKGNVTEYYRSRPDYWKPLEDCIPAQDLEFYKGLRRTSDR